MKKAYIQTSNRSSLPFPAEKKHVLFLVPQVKQALGLLCGMGGMSGEAQGQRCGGTGMDMAAWGCAVLVGGRGIERAWRCAVRVGELLKIYPPEGLAMFGRLRRPLKALQGQDILRPPKKQGVQPLRAL